jgi:flagellar protein FliO/FliZ
VEADLGSAVMKMLGSLILILGLIFVFFYFLKKVKGGTFAFTKSPLHLISVLNLAPRRSIALVEVNEQWLVLGVTPDRITVLDKMVKPPAAQLVHKEESAGFQALLRQTIFKKRFKGQEKQESNDLPVPKKE